MVVHLKDQPHTIPLDLLKALLEQAENDVMTRTLYPQSTSAQSNPLPKPAELYHRKLQADKWNDGYTVHPTQLDAASTGEVSEVETLFSNFYEDNDPVEVSYHDGFLIGLWQATEISEYRNGRCFNCHKEGHHWRQCKELLSIELQGLVDKMDQAHRECENALNLQGDTRVKGGHAPAPFAEVSLALPQAVTAPAK